MRRAMEAAAGQRAHRQRPQRAQLAMWAALHHRILKEASTCHRESFWSNSYYLHILSVLWEGKLQFKFKYSTLPLSESEEPNSSNAFRFLLMNWSCDGSIDFSSLTVRCPTMCAWITGEKKSPRFRLRNFPPLIALISSSCFRHGIHSGPFCVWLMLRVWINCTACVQFSILLALHHRSLSLKRKDANNFSRRMKVLFPRSQKRFRPVSHKMLNYARRHPWACLTSRRQREISDPQGMPRDEEYCPKQFRLEPLRTFPGRKYIMVMWAFWSFTGHHE